MWWEYFVARRGDLFVAFPRIIGSIIHRVPATHAYISTTRLYTDTDVFWPDKKVNPSLISGIMILYLGFRLQRKPDNCCDHWLDCRPQTQDTPPPHSCNGKLSQFNISCDWTQIRTLVCGNLDIVTSLTWNKSWTLEFVDITSTGIERIVIILIIDHLLGRLHIHIQLI